MNKNDLVSFATIHETDSGPVLIYKKYNHSSERPFQLVVIANRINGDEITCTNSYLTDANREYDYQYPESLVKWALKQIPKCERLAEKEEQS